MDKVDEIHSISSLAGFEGLIFDKKVYCYGIPFYANWGLTNDKFNCNRRTTKLSLNQLIAGALVKYPYYFDWQSKLPAPPDVILKNIAENKTSPNSSLPYILRYIFSIIGSKT